MTKEIIELQKYTASEGVVLFNGEIYSKEIYLGKNDSIDNWKEIPEPEVSEDILLTLI